MTRVLTLVHQISLLQILVGLHTISLQGHFKNYTYAEQTGKVLATVLALYMADQSLPLPTFEEVLVCTASTTFEEV